MRKLIDGYPEINENTLKGMFSQDLFSSIISNAGYNFQTPRPLGDFGVDFSIRKMKNRGGGVRDYGSLLDLQLKCTSDFIEEDNCFKYSLSNKTLNDMIDRNRNYEAPLILVVLLVPPDFGNRIHFNEKEMIFRNQFYWYVTDLMELKENENSATIIILPKTNVFDKNSITSLLEKFAYKKVQNDKL